MKEELKLLLNGMGALGEMCGLMRDELMKNGFTRREAVSLVGNFIQVTFQPNTNKEET